MELQNIGLNWETFFFVGAVLTMIYSYWGAGKQALGIRRGISRSVSTVMVVYLATFVTCCSIWGIYVFGIALLLNWPRAALLFWVIVELWRKKALSRLDWAFLVGCVVLVGLLVFLPDSNLEIASITKTPKDWLFTLAGIGMAAFIVPQPIKILCERSSAGLDLNFLLSALAVVSLWAGYAVMFVIWPLIISNILQTLLLIVTLVLWFVYRNRTSQS